MWEKGFTQRDDIDYNEICSLVVKHMSMRELLALTTQFNWKMEQLDVKTGFLYGELDEMIYMKLLEGYE